MLLFLGRKIGQVARPCPGNPLGHSELLYLIKLRTWKWVCCCSWQVDAGLGTAPRRGPLMRRLGHLAPCDIDTIGGKPR